MRSTFTRKFHLVPPTTQRSVMPNPSNGPVWLAYRVPEGVGRVELRCYDLHGRLMLQRSLGAHDGILELSTGDWSNGLYLPTLFFDGIQVGAVKFELHR